MVTKKQQIQWVDHQNKSYSKNGAQIVEEGDVEFLIKDNSNTSVS